MAPCVLAWRGPPAAPAALLPCSWARVVQPPRSPHWLSCTNFCFGSFVRWLRRSLARREKREATSDRSLLACNKRSDLFCNKWEKGRSEQVNVIRDRVKGKETAAGLVETLLLAWTVLTAWYVHNTSASTISYFTLMRLYGLKHFTSI